MKPNHSSNRVGDMSEFYAVTWLWDQGYEVFVNAGSDGMVDMIAWHPSTEETILIDVKTVRCKHRQSGRFLSLEQRERGVRVLKYNADSRELDFVRHHYEKSD